MIALALSALIAAAGAGETVSVSGVIAHSGSGPIRVELLTRSPGVQPMLAWAGILPGPGPFTLEVPQHLGAVTLRAAADGDGDGVGPEDPQDLVERLEITTEPVAGVELSLRPPRGAKPVGSDARE